MRVYSTELDKNILLHCNLSIYSKYHFFLKSLVLYLINYRIKKTLANNKMTMLHWQTNTINQYTGVWTKILIACSNTIQKHIYLLNKFMKDKKQYILDIRYINKWKIYSDEILAARNIGQNLNNLLHIKCYVSFALFFSAVENLKLLFFQNECKFLLCKDELCTMVINFDYSKSLHLNAGLHKGLYCLFKQVFLSYLYTPYLNIEHFLKNTFLKFLLFFAKVKKQFILKLLSSGSYFEKFPFKLFTLDKTSLVTVFNFNWGDNKI